MAPLTRGVVAALLLAGCGDALRSETYVGDPRYSFEVLVSDPQERGDTLPGALRVAIFWASDLEVDAWVEDPEVSHALAGTGPVTLNLYGQPAQRVEGTSFAIGRALAYDDRDGDGRFGRGDMVVGGLSTRALVLAPAGVPLGDGPFGAPLPAGATVVELPLDCGQSRPAASAARCPVPLGRPCQRPDQCGPGGACLRDLGGPFPMGACAIAHTAAPPMCSPAEGGYVPFAYMPGVRGYFVAGCATDGDCAPGLRCALGQGACLPPGPPLRVELIPGIQLPPICRSQWPAEAYYTSDQAIEPDGQAPVTVPHRPPPTLPPRPR